MSGQTWYEAEPKMNTTIQLISYIHELMRYAAYKYRNGCREFNTESMTEGGVALFLYSAQCTLRPQLRSRNPDFGPRRQLFSLPDLWKYGRRPQVSL